MSIYMEHGKNSRQTVKSKWLCMFTDYIEQCRRFSSLTWWSFAFDCVCVSTLCNMHKEHIGRVSTTTTTKFKSIAIIRLSSNKYYNENKNQMRYTLTFDKFIQLISRLSCCYHCNFERFVRFFSSSVSLIYFLFFFIGDYGAVTVNV